MIIHNAYRFNPLRSPVAPLWHVRLEPWMAVMHSGLDPYHSQSITLLIRHVVALYRSQSTYSSTTTLLRPDRSRHNAPFLMRIGRTQCRRRRRGGLLEARRQASAKAKNQSMFMVSFTFPQPLYESYSAQCYPVSSRMTIPARLEFSRGECLMQLVFASDVGDDGARELSQLGNGVGTAAVAPCIGLETV